MSQVERYCQPATHLVARLMQQMNLRQRTSQIKQMEANLTATLPDTWLPMAKYTALLEASMRQRGYEVQILVLNSTVAAMPADGLPAPADAEHGGVPVCLKRASSPIQEVLPLPTAFELLGFWSASASRSGSNLGSGSGAGIRSGSKSGLNSA